MLKELSIEILRKCPNNCLHCSSLSTEHCSEIIPLSKFKEVVQSAKNLGLQTVCLSGGEPFLHPDILEMVAFLHQERLNSFIYTSGICLDEQARRIPIPTSVISKLSSTVSKLIFNVEAANEAVYDAIMGTTGNFPILLESIRRAVDSGVRVEGHFVPNKLNFKQIEKTLELCKSLGASRLSFLRLVLHGRAFLNRSLLQMSASETEKMSQLLHQIQTENHYPIRIGFPLSDGSGICQCEAAYGKVNIRYDGRVYPCEAFKNNQVRALDGITPESIFEKDIADIYQSSEYFKAVRQLIREFSSGNYCEKCVGQYYLR